MSIHPPQGVPLHLLLPLLSGIVYVAGALLLKRASELGADVWRTARICNFTSAAVFAPLALFGGTIPDAQQFWQPALAALLFVLGQVFTLLSLRMGDAFNTLPLVLAHTAAVRFMGSSHLLPHMPRAGCRRPNPHRTFWH
jgi:drug/metabolite transporter (DMT)-like permease